MLPEGIACFCQPKPTRFLILLLCFVGCHLTISWTFYRLHWLKPFLFSESERKVHRKFTGWWFRRLLKVKQIPGVSTEKIHQPTGLWPMLIWTMVDLTHLSWVEIRVLVGQTWLDHGFSQISQISFNGSDFHIELRNPCYFVVLDNPIYCDGSLAAQHWFESLTWSNTT